MSLSHGPQRNPCKVEFEWGNDLHHYTSARTKESSPWAGRRLSSSHYLPLPSGRQPSFIISRLFSFYLHTVWKKMLNWEINIISKQKFHNRLCWSWSYYRVSKRLLGVSFLRLCLWVPRCKCSHLEVSDGASVMALCSCLHEGCCLLAFWSTLKPYTQYQDEVFAGMFLSIAWLLCTDWFYSPYSLTPGSWLCCSSNHQPITAASVSSYCFSSSFWFWNDFFKCVCMCVYVSCMPQEACDDQSSSRWGQFPYSTFMPVSGIELRIPGVQNKHLYLLYHLISPAIHFDFCTTSIPALPTCAFLC